MAPATPPSAVPSAAPPRFELPAAADATADALLRAVLGPVSALAVWLDAAGAVRFVNEAFLHATGWATGEVLGADWDDGFVPAGCPARALFQAALGGTVGHGEGELFTRQGERRRIAWDAVPVRDAAGRPAGAVFMGRDVTEERRVARDRDHLARALAARAERDTLTGLLNAPGFTRATEHARRVAARIHRVDAVVAVRLRSLAAAAPHGASAVDDAVCAVAEALSGVVRDSDLVARVAPDAFAVYAVGTGAPEHGAATVRRVRAALAAHDGRARDAGRTFDLGCAVGSAERAPGEEFDLLVARALTAADAAGVEAPNRVARWAPR